jgi:N-acetylglutamate synthase-like GNAT family acetyltransferase
MERNNKSKAGRWHIAIERAEMIKEATLNGRKVLAKLIRDSFRDVARRFSLTKENCPKHPSNCASSWIESDISRGVQYYILYVDENPIGCAAIENASSDVCYLERLSVLPEMRGKHFGIRLVQHALERAALKGARKVSIGIIDEQIDLKEWYIQLGFVVTEIKRFPHLPFAVCLMEIEIGKRQSKSAR